MNTKNIMVFVLMFMVLSANAFSNLNDNKQDKKKVTTVGVFDGYDIDDGYSFLINIDPDDEFSGDTIFIMEITDEVLKTVNLKSKDVIGKRFEITYEITEIEEEDENGFLEVYETYKLVQIKKL
ncbi:hypothetical protein DFQ11_101265 [Winogradskyella epiphytica]|uniref:Uncharacterized protein n=1 Tax=Winogradskyella epiphytica TaxID=262005 RepID=A0A2V4WYU7_9FLAO|nr:hypothetical protein [Winogradskyella epiphytica]PYE82836.1 hypothetical protein DFQ11_101265 [Winogradskyella epiphytica]GGW53998.1 hypothetical protein GCM10008085_01380 [Winogradskyella epiphytica]